MIQANASQTRTVADPNAAYESIRPLWERSRAACNGERYVKELDKRVDTLGFNNFLIPFSPSMTQQQYDFYKAEAEYPGIVAQYAKIVVGGLLRKKPQLELPKSIPEEATNWIMNAFTQDSQSLSSFLDSALWEELQTSRAWVYVDFPVVPDAANKTRAETADLKPYPVIWKAENIVNWRYATNSTTGKKILDRVIIRGFEERYDDNVYEFHPEMVDTVWVHEIKDGKYQIRKFQANNATQQVEYINGQNRQNNTKVSPKFTEVGDAVVFLVNGETIDFIPAWPLNGSVDCIEPMLSPLIDKEMALYNKLSRRNHLLYGASTYTPWIASDMPDEDFEALVANGLGTWIRLRQDDTCGVLETPTEALEDMDRAIASNIEEMAKMGIRMLTPESEQSGIALEIRNAAQTAQLGTLNMKVSTIMSDVIAFMIAWKYDIEILASEVKFTLSTDFNPAPLGDAWLRLATEWYEKGLIPRSVWLQIMKQNDILAPDYNDEDGQAEINSDELIVKPAEQKAFENEMLMKNKGV
jgi:hypothetical protein